MNSLRGVIFEFKTFQLSPKIVHREGNLIDVESVGGSEAKCGLFLVLDDFLRVPTECQRL
jgi:hypothetical protein